MDWFVADKNYVEYLHNFDYKVGKVDYGDKLKLHVGTILEINDFKFYVPVSSPKEKHKHMKNSLDFQKIEDNQNNLYAVININNMIPIPEQYITKLKYNEIEKFRAFHTEKEKTDYIYLLQKEKAIIDQLASTLQKKAIKLYCKVTQNPDSTLAKRCCNFELLQEKATEYHE